MARVRSPNYPSISLVKAIELAGKIYNKEHLHPATPEVVAKAIGYSGINGASLGIISALKKYGLLEGRGTNLKISPDALTILVDTKDSVERIQAIRKAAFLPALFAELQKHYGETLPSDENIRSFLLKREFSQSMVDAPIRSYRETIGLVNEVSSGYNEPLSNPDEENQMEQAQKDKPPAAAVKPPSASIGLPSAQEGSKQDVFTLDEGQVVIQWPANMSEDSFEDFKAWLKLLEKKIGRAYNKKIGEDLA